MRLAANLSLLYRDLPYLERFARARADGFEAVESWWPSGEDPGQVAAVAQEVGLPLVLLNIEAGDTASGERGFFNRPEERDRVLAATRTAIDLASRTACRRLNALVGNRVGDDAEAELAAALPTLREAAAMAAAAGMRLSIEALNGDDTPRYLVQSTARARALVADIGHGAGVQFDTYHMGRMGEDLVAVAREFGSELAHVQIADFPGRHEPGTGELPFDAFFAALRAAGYQGDAGLEFLPTRPVAETLAAVRERLASDAGRAVDDHLVEDGKVIRLETVGRRSGSPVVVTVGFMERADGTLVVAAGDREAAWAMNLLADPGCRVTLRDATFAAEARELDGAERNGAIRDLILRYGTPSERLGSGPAFVLQPVETPPSEASRRSR